MMQDVKRVLPEVAEGVGGSSPGPSQAEVREGVAERAMGEAEQLDFVMRRCRLLDPAEMVSCPHSMRENRITVEPGSVRLGVVAGFGEPRAHDMVHRELPPTIRGKTVVGADGVLRFVTEAEQAGGVKHDQGKDPWGLLPFDAIRQIVKVLQFGRGKYGARNWEKGMDWSRPFEACLRHLTAWWEGEKADPETGLSHLAHAGCCIVFMLAYELRGVGRDDRPGA